MTKGANLLFLVRVADPSGQGPQYWLYLNPSRRYPGASITARSSNKIPGPAREKFNTWNKARSWSTQINQRREAIEAIEVELKNSQQAIPLVGMWASTQRQTLSSITKANPVKQYFFR